MKTDKIFISEGGHWMIIILGFIALAVISGCKKDFLDAKPSKALLVPTTLPDFDAIMDNNNVFNIGQELNEIASDDLYTTTDGWQSLATPQEQNTYIFADHVFAGQNFISEWNTPYQQVFYANVVLDGLTRLNGNNDKTNYDRVKGTALFHRAFAFYGLSQLFTKPYNSGSASTDLGIPLRLNSQIDQKSVRASLASTYQQIISDLENAKDLLPVTSKYKSRPSRAAAFGMLARVYLSMLDYKNAMINADSCLNLYNKLYDYNAFDPASTSPFPQVLPDNGDEVIWYARLTGYSYETSSLTFVDSTLYKLYAPNDLRAPVFYMDNGLRQFNYKGTYEGNYYFFGGLATDEIYLIRAECHARAGETDAAMSDLNTLLFSRWATGTFIPYTAASASAALKIILQERRKELVARGLRWSDLRRLNMDPAFEITVTHEIGGKTDQLSPGDKRYVFPIPDYEIQTSGIQQN
jgi:hypothetical protein